MIYYKKDETKINSKDFRNFHVCGCADFDVIDLQNLRHYSYEYDKISGKIEKLKSLQENLDLLKDI